MTTIQIKWSDVVGKEPSASDLVVGELAVNLADGKLYSKNTANAVIDIGGAGAVEDKETNPVINYTSGVVTRIDYASTNYKLFTYTDGLLTRVDYHKGAQVLRKDLVYVNGRLSQIIDTVV